MKPTIANLINAIVLIVMSLWGYFASESPSPTAFIPAGFGLVLLLLQGGLARENKVVAHIVVVLTLLVIIALAAKPLPGAVQREDTMAIVRISLMLLTSALAMFTFIRSFIEARKAREGNA